MRLFMLLLVFLAGFFFARFFVSFSIHYLHLFYFSSVLYFIFEPRWLLWLWIRFIVLMLKCGIHGLQMASAHRFFSIFYNKAFIKNKKIETETVDVQCEGKSEREREKNRWMHTISLKYTWRLAAHILPTMKLFIYTTNLSRFDAVRLVGIIMPFPGRAKWNWCSQYGRNLFSRTHIQSSHWNVWRQHSLTTDVFVSPQNKWCY